MPLEELVRHLGRDGRLRRGADVGFLEGDGEDERDLPGEECQGS